MTLGLIHISPARQSLNILSLNFLSYYPVWGLRAGMLNIFVFAEIFKYLLSPRTATASVIMDRGQSFKEYEKLTLTKNY
jgi:hypothetical protein